MYLFSTKGAGHVLNRGRDIPETAATTGQEDEAHGSYTGPMEAEKCESCLEIKIEDVMKREVVTIREETPLEEVFALFEKYRFHTFPVVDSGGNLVGIIDQDIILEILLFTEVPRAKHTHLTAVRSLGAEAKEIMITHPVTVSLDSTIRHTADLMMKHRFDRVCVTEDGKLVGVISKRDLVNEISRRKKEEKREEKEQGE